MTTPKTIQLRLTLSPFHISYISQKIEAWIFDYQKTSPYSTITAPNIIHTIDLLHANILPVTRLPYYDNYSITITIFQNPSPH